MKRNAVLTACYLTLLWAPLCYTGTAQAIPGEQSELLEGTQPLPDFSAVAHPPSQSVPPVISADTASSADESAPASEPEISTADNSDESHTASSAIPCMVNFEEEYTTADSCEDGETEKQLSVQFGQRMGAGNSSILGEFDGISVDYRLARGLTLNGVAGYPVLSDNDKFNDTRQVFGVSANTAKFAHDWDLNSYLIEQMDNGQARRNAGGALRYLRPKRSLLLLFDYDMAERSLDALTASGALRLPRNTTLSAIVDVRSNPMRKRQQKYLQQTMNITEGWTWNLPMDRISYFTNDLSEEVTTLSVGLTHSFSNRLKLTGSAARLEVARDNGIDVGTAIPSEYFYHLQLSGNDLMFSGNSNILDLSHRITGSTRTSSATFDTRCTVNRRWKVSPRLRADYRDNILDRSVQWVTAPSVKMEYQWRDRYGVRIEAGGEWVTRELYDHEADNDSSYFVKLGYKANF